MLFPFRKQQTPKNTILVLDGVRAIACLNVVAYHINRFTLISHVWQPVGPLAFPLMMTGWSGVTLFFVLSGFLLFMPYAKALLFDSDWPAMRQFYLRRALRILPGYYVSLFLLILLANPQYLRPDHFKNLGLFLILFMDASPQTYQRINGPFWTLAVEWQFYLLLPFLAFGFLWVVKRVSLRRRMYALILCLLAMIAWGIATRYWGRSWELYPTQTALLPRPIHNVALFLLYGTAGKYLEDFAVGMLVSVFYVFAKNTSPESRLSTSLRRYSLWLWWAGVVQLFFMTTWYAIPNSTFLGSLIAPHNWLCELGFALGFGLCITGILFGPPALKRPFEWGPLCWIGSISYSLYIWHLPILLFFIADVVPSIQSWANPLVYSLYWLCFLLIIVPFAYASYRWVEQPWMQVAPKRRASTPTSIATKKTLTT